MITCSETFSFREQLKLGGLQLVYTKDAYVAALK